MRLSHDTRVSHRMVCASVQEDNPRALASRLSPVQTQNHTMTCLLHQHAFVHCALRDIRRCGINKMCDNSTYHMVL